MDSGAEGRTVGAVEGRTVGGLSTQIAPMVGREGPRGTLTCEDAPVGQTWAAEGEIWVLPAGRGTRRPRREPHGAR